MSSTTASFRHRLQLKHRQHQLHIQTNHNMPPPPWPGPTSAITPGGSAGVGSALSPDRRSLPPISATSTRPPLSPRGYSSAAATTGQSRFVEGSMNDRVSAVPPAGFLGFTVGIEGGEEGEAVVGKDGGNGGGGAEGEREVAGYGWEVGQRQGQGQGQHGHQHHMSEPGLNGYGVVGAGQGESAEDRYHLRRPRSTAGWVRSGTQEQQRGGVVKKTSFLAPLWDGVREKLHLSKSKSSGSIGRVVNSVVGGGGGSGNGGMDRKVEKEKERVTTPEETERVAPVQPPPSTVGYPSREEVLESYKNLVASGFFEAHAIRGGRHPLRTGNAPAPANGRSFADHLATPTSPTGKSFAEHMAVPGTEFTSPGKSFADHMAAQQKPALSFSPTRHSMGPPPPPRGSSQGKPTTLSSPQRGTKRGASIDLAGDAEMVTRKLVKKLRHSASRISVELTGSRDNHYTSYGTLRSRTSTSSNPPGPLSPPSSVFSGITSPPAPNPDADTASVRHGKLTKPKEGGRRRRILGLTRRHRSPAPPTTTTTSTEADPDAMMIDEPEPTPAPKPIQLDQPPFASKPHQNITPPSAAFRTHHPRSLLRTSNTISGSTLASVHEPLSVVPDPNQGIPFVPRIPREFCDAMAALAPSPVEIGGGGGGGGGGAAAAAAAAGSAVVFAGKQEGEVVKNVNRDSGLGEDVENLPVWG